MKTVKTMLKGVMCFVFFAVVIQAYGATKAPYLMFDGDNTKMTVMWQDSATATDVINWGLTTSYGSTANSTEYGADHQHKYVITGLTPGTKYYYQVVGKGTGSFTAAPASSATNVKLFIWGDTRSQPNQVAANCARMIAKYGSDAAFQSIALHVGDWVTDNTEGSWTGQWFNSGQANINTFISNVPNIGCIGNHESGASTYLKYYPQTWTGSFYRSFDYGPAHVVILNSQASGGFGTGTAQYTWLQNDLASTSKLWKIIVYHAPAWSAGGGHANDTKAQQCQPLWVAQDVSMVFAGHNHYYSRALNNGVHHVTTGGGGAPLYTPASGQPYIVATSKSYQFTELTISGNSATLVARNSSGTQIDTFTVTKSGSNNPPAFSSDPFSKANATQGVAYSASIASNASDPDAGDTITFSKVSGPAWLSVASNGALTGTPAAGDVGANVFTVRVTDNHSASDTATMNITVVSAANHPPVFSSDPFSKANATETKAYSGSISGDAFDPDAGDTLTFSKVSGPTWLSVASNGALSGTPDSGDVGGNVFTVRATDNHAASTDATMNIAVVTVGGTTIVTFTSIAAEDGYLIESSETSNVGGTATANGTGPEGVRMGDNVTLNEQEKGLVSFDTSSIPDDATIISAELSLMRGRVVGTNPFSGWGGTCYVDIKGGSGFGGATALAAGDFEAAADATQVATMTAPAADGDWSQGALNATGLSKINTTGKTQLRLYFSVDDNNNLTEDHIGFYSGDNATPANWPQLTVTYSAAGANDPPVFYPDVFPKADATQGVAYSGTITDMATDPDVGDTLTFSKNSGPAWLSVASNGALSGTPGSGDVGLNSFDVRVTDAGGLYDDAVMDITVVASAPTQVTFTSIAAEDGYVTESSETSNVGGSANATGTGTEGVRMGDNVTLNKQIKGVVSFDTSSIPDGATIVSAQLSLMRGTVVGTNPFSAWGGNCYVDIKGGSGFGGATALAMGDFEAAADATQVATMSAPAANGDWSQGDLNSTGLTKINKTGKTQLRLYFSVDDNNNLTEDHIGFYSGDNATPANRPQLVVNYQ